MMADEKRLIYREDTMEKLRAYAYRKHMAGHTELANGILKAVNYIHNEIRRADAVEVVHGRWVHGFSVRCSVCNGYALTDEDHDSWITPYCPNCGAKMDGGSHEID